MATSKLDTIMSEEEFAIFVDGLPREKCRGHVNFNFVYQWDGYWYPIDFLKAAIAAQPGFLARDDDVFLTSSAKTGTTWLKALIPCIMALNRDNIDQEEDDPLLTNHPNQLMPSIEISIFNPKNLDSDVLNIDEMPSPRLFRTHLPYSKLPESIKNDNSSCKLVYITREPKDVFVSLWHFMNSISNAEPRPTMDEEFDNFCKGIHPFGPFHDHVLEYWNESLKKPEKILFLRYEEMKKDPKGQVKKLAEFLDRPFANEEELDNVLWRCSLERLKNLQVNKNGLEPSLGIPKIAYFRNGLVGDGKNSLTKEMQERLDKITREKFEGTGLDLQVI